MVTADVRGRGTRYRLLDTLRDYGVSRLAARHELDDARRGHLATSSSSPSEHGASTTGVPAARATRRSSTAGTTSVRRSSGPLPTATWARLIACCAPCSARVLRPAPRARPLGGARARRRQGRPADGRDRRRVPLQAIRHPAGQGAGRDRSRRAARAVATARRCACSPSRTAACTAASSPRRGRLARQGSAAVDDDGDPAVVTSASPRPPTSGRCTTRPRPIRSSIGCGRSPSGSTIPERRTASRSPPRCRPSTEAAPRRPNTCAAGDGDRRLDVGRRCTSPWLAEVLAASVMRTRRDDIDGTVADTLTYLYDVGDGGAGGILESVAIR